MITHATEWNIISVNQIHISSIYVDTKFVLTELNMAGNLL